MKKVMAAAVVLAVLFLFGCAQTPSGPGPSGDPFVPADGDLFDGFEDGNKISEYDSMWTSGDDGSLGGSSIVHSFDILEGEGYGGGNALRISATATAQLSQAAYQPLAAFRSGYVTVKCNLGSDGADLSNTTNANTLYFRVKETSGTGALSLRGYIYNSAGQYVYTYSQNITDTYSFAEVSYYDAAVPTGAAYSVNDVLKNARRFEIEIRYYNMIDSVASFEVLFDGFTFGMAII